MSATPPPPPQASPDNRSRDKRACPDCGGDLAWDARRLAFACPYCGTVVGNEAPAPGIDPNLEHDLLAALANPQLEASGIAERELVCQSCQAVTVFDPKVVAQRCEFCGSPSIVAREQVGDAILPQAVLPFIVAESAVRDALRKWYGSRWFAPNRLKKAALTDTLKGVYLPYWTFDAQVHAQWQAESGEHHYTGTGNNRKRHTRWRWTSGQVSQHFDDVLVCGSIGAHEALLRGIEPFPTLTDLKPYAEEYLRGWVVERAQRQLPEATQVNEAEIRARIEALCARAVPGDTHRNLRVEMQLQDRRFKHVLLPVWLVSYTFGSKSYQVLANGHTGKLAGEHPWSWIKIALAVMAAVAVVLVLVRFAE
jgi:predicted RNA-binding Zn-ribbon protein involved in translation (DUF1610 family)